MFKIKLHSIVDVITNSSTVIYTPITMGVLNLQKILLMRCSNYLV